MHALVRQHVLSGFGETTCFKWSSYPSLGHSPDVSLGLLASVDCYLGLALMGTDLGHCCRLTGHDLCVETSGHGFYL